MDCVQIFTANPRNWAKPQPKPPEKPGKKVHYLIGRDLTKNCMPCHQIGAEGGAVGPALDGIASRGTDRLIEDILDPKRNLDPSFRYSTIILTDNQVITGLQRREDAGTIVFIDTTGKEVAVPQGRIKRRIPSNASLMPDNFADVIAAEEFNHLMAFLLSKRPTS